MKTKKNITLIIGIIFFFSTVNITEALPLDCLGSNTVLVERIYYSSIELDSNNANDEKVEWGKDVNGLQIRIACSAKDCIFDSNQIPVFWLDISNTSNEICFCANLEQFCEVEIDGKWYRWKGVFEADVASAGLGPKEVRYNFLTIILDQNWIPKESAALSLRTHTIRVKYSTYLERNKIEVFSNLLKFKII